MILRQELYRCATTKDQSIDFLRGIRGSGYRVNNWSPDLDDGVVIILAAGRAVEDGDDGAGLCVLDDG